MNPVNPDNPVNPFSVPECVFWSNTPTSSLTLYEFLTFTWTSKLKLLLVKAFLEDCLPEILSKVGVLAGRPMKKSIKHRAIAQAALGDCGDPAPA